MHWFAGGALQVLGERLRQPGFFDQQVFVMAMPRRYAIPKNCLSCTLRQSGDFCNLPQPLMAVFNGMGHLTLYPGNATLLMEGHPPRGVYIVCSGRAKLSVEARDGKTIILKIAGDRQVLGLSTVVTGGTPRLRSPPSSCARSSS